VGWGSICAIFLERSPLVYVCMIGVAKVCAWRTIP